MLKLMIAASAFWIPATSASAIWVPEAAAEQTADWTVDEMSLVAADARQRDAVASKNLLEIDKISHPNLRINAPNNRVLTKDDLIRMVGDGEIRNDVFERTPESVVITGDIGVVMGHELVLPGPGSEQARMYGEKRLARRYTNVYLRVDGEWLHLARHANIIPEK